MESKHYRVDMFGDEPGHIMYQFSGSSTLEEAHAGIKNWMVLRPELKYHRITKFHTIQTELEDNRPVKGRRSSS